MANPIRIDASGARDGQPVRVHADDHLPMKQCHYPMAGGTNNVNQA